MQSNYYSKFSAVAKSDLPSPNRDECRAGLAADLSAGVVM